MKENRNTLHNVVHKYDPTIHNLTQPSECYSYYNQNKADIVFLTKKVFIDYSE